MLFLAAFYWIFSAEDLLPSMEALGRCWAEETEQAWPIAPTVSPHPVVCDPEGMTGGCTYYYMGGDPNLAQDAFAMLTDEMTDTCAGRTYDTNFGEVTLPAVEDKQELEDDWFWWYWNI